MRTTSKVLRGIAGVFLTSALVLGVSSAARAQNGYEARPDNHGGQQEDHGRGHEDSDNGGPAEKVLYIWAQDQAQVAPDFLAVIDFDEQSPKYGQVITRRTRCRLPATPATSRTTAT